MDLSELIGKIDDIERLVKPVLVGDHIDISEEFDKHVASLRLICSNMASVSTTLLPKNSQTYASITKMNTAPASGYLPTVLILPVNPSQSSAETFQCVKDTVNIKSGRIKIEKTKYLRNGSVLITAQDANSINMIKKSLANSNDKVSVRAPVIKFPFLKIKSIDKSVADEEFVNSLINQNDLSNDLHKSSIKVVRTITKQRSTDKIIQCHPDIWQKIMAIGKISIGWGRHFAVNYIPVVRCFKCQAFGHRAADCRSPSAICCNCARDHETTKCTNRASSCANCSKHGFKPVSNHNAASVNCPYYLRIRDSISKSIVYQTNILNA